MHIYTYIYICICNTYIYIYNIYIIYIYIISKDPPDVLDINKVIKEYHSLLCLLLLERHSKPTFCHCNKN